MKKILFISAMVLFGISFSGCRTSKDYLERNDDLKAFQSASKQLSKNSADEKASEAIPILYKNITENRIKQIHDLEQVTDLRKFDKMLKLYGDLQTAYDVAINTPAVFKLVNPVSYSSEILATKQDAAEAYYQAGQKALNLSTRIAYKQAYSYFNTSLKYVPDFRDAQSLASQAFEQAMISVVVNPIIDNSFFLNNSWNSGLSFTNDYFQQSLVRDLNNMSKNRYPSEFYTDWQARSQRITPDWIVDLYVRKIVTPFSPNDYRYKKNLSAKVEIGKDTSGKPQYKTVYATLNIIRSTIIARADMDVTINDYSSGKLIGRRTFNQDYRWQVERATYTGDSRALSSDDWALINQVYHVPQRDALLEELYKRMYPDVRSYLDYETRW